MWAEVSNSSSKFKISPPNFWDGIRVWIERPHILNQRLFSVEVKHSWKIKWKQGQCPKGASSLDGDNILMFLASSLTVKNDDLIEHLMMFLETVPCEQVFEYMKEPEGPERDTPDLVLQIRELLPKQPEKHHPVTEVLVFDKQRCSVIFATCVSEHCGLCVPFPYRLMCQDGRIKLFMPKDLIQIHKFMEGSGKWLKEVLLPKLARWSIEIPDTPAVPSLLEVPASRYSANYHRLKAKYGKKLVEMWPECTDPLKYVYEDIGIAAYLVTLWEEERKARKTDVLQTFVDLGCGNGLLVYILTSEGYKGCGIDVRKRNIWDSYGPDTKLVEKALTPSDSMLFPEYDWIIGNHSDELTPWIPVIAARSSYKTRAFILPCCLYTFDGKYQRAHADKSAYQSYLEFIHSVCVVMGFHVKMDKLRIASVRRICFLCMSRSYDYRKEQLTDLERTKFIQLHSVRTLQAKSKDEPPQKSQKSIKMDKSQQDSGKDRNENDGEIIEDSGNQKWISSFQPREKKVSVHNCTNLDPQVLNSLISEIMRHLLGLKENFVTVMKDEEEILWNAGGCLSLEELAKVLNPVSLLNLKNQCGGLQTLLRNHRNIFTIDEGKVLLTTPSRQVPQVTVSKKRGKRSKIKKKKKASGENNNTKPCFFHLFHPNGCPLSSDKCSFIH